MTPVVVLLHFRSARVWLWLATVAVALARPTHLAHGQLPTPPAPPGTKPSAPIVVTPNFRADHYLDSRTAIELTVSRVPLGDEGSLAILLGTTDLTALFDRRGDRLVYRARVVALPSGDNEVSVYLTSASVWTELGRFPIRVLSPHGFEKSSITPVGSVNNKGQLAEGHSAAQMRPDRPTFQDVQLATGFQSSQLRGSWLLESRGNAIGVTNRREALRFGDRGDHAPRFDLSDYSVRLQRGAAKLALGNVSLGTNRHLMSGFASRGATFELGSPAVSLAVGGLGGSPTVGWDDPLGFTRPSHRVLGGMLGVELQPRRPGALHVDFTLVDGSILPRTGFTQNAVTDAQRSTGAGVQVSASTPEQRVRVSGGFAESRFVNPPDPLLDGGLHINPVAPTRKMARYLETSAILLRSVHLGSLPTANLTTNWRHEHVDPLYRSVTAFTRADVLSNTVDANATIGVVALQASHARFSDNLARIPSLLTTNTHTTTTQAALPFASLFRVTSAWVPTAAYSFNETHQFGAGVPVNAGFTAANVPDQVSTVHDASLQWQRGRWRAGYRFNRSFQDNRQPGHEHADLSVATHATTFGVNSSSLDVGVDLSTERQVNLERAVRGTVERLGLTTNWRPAVGTGIATTYTASRNADAPRTERSGNSELRVELSRALALGRRAEQGARAQAFMRYARQSANATRFLTDLTQPRFAQATWSVSSGLNFLVF